MPARTMLIALTALVVAGSTTIQAATDITGKWTASFDTQIGEQKYTYEFRVSGSTLTGTAASENGKTEITEGKVDGETVTFVENLNFQGMPLKITYTGKIVSADQIDFTRNVADIATEKLVATRVK